ncbi:hypothetical protein H2248_008993 [Termitomyces sp. 'cryptogamus']|nr:hypothetical protein H2248_008993 [Termitomyces sp. 'cryptogamus']
MAESDFFFEDIPGDPNLDLVPHFKFSHLSLNRAESDEPFLIMILVAEILGVMRPFLEIELRGHSERQIASHSRDSVQLASLFCPAIDKGPRASTSVKISANTTVVRRYSESISEEGPTWSFQLLPGSWRPLILSFVSLIRN